MTGSSGRSSFALLRLAATLERTSRALSYLPLMRLAEDLRAVAAAVETLARTCCGTVDDPSSFGPAEP
jgi:hypothetical protein